MTRPKVIFFVTNKNIKAVCEIHLKISVSADILSTQEMCFVDQIHIISLGISVSVLSRLKM